MRYLFILLAIFMAGCDQSGGEQTAAPTPTAAPAPTPEAAYVPPAPTHNYVMEDGGMYGYASPVSADDANSGDAQSRLAMIRYLGKKNDAYIFSSESQPRFALRLSCKAPCEFLKAENLVNGKVIAKEFMPSAGTLGMAMLEDAQNGFLKVYNPKTSANSL